MIARPAGVLSRAWHCWCRRSSRPIRTARSSRRRVGRTGGARRSSWPSCRRAPLAIEAVRRIDELFAIEREIRERLLETAAIIGIMAVVLLVLWFNGLLRWEFCTRANACSGLRRP